MLPLPITTELANKVKLPFPVMFTSIISPASGVKDSTDVRLFVVVSKGDSVGVTLWESVVVVGTVLVVDCLVVVLPTVVVESVVIFGTVVDFV